MAVDWQPFIPLKCTLVPCPLDFHDQMVYVLMDLPSPEPFLLKRNAHLLLINN